MKKIIWLWKRYWGKKLIIKISNELKEDEVLIYNAEDNAIYEVMKDDAILGPFNIVEIAEFVHSGLVLKRDYAYSLENPDKFKTVDFFLKKHGKNVSVEHKGNIFSQIKEIGKELIIPYTIFTKEPTAFSGGNKLAFAPVLL